MPKLVSICLNEHSFPILCDPNSVEIAVNDFCVLRDEEEGQLTGFVDGFSHLCDCQVEGRKYPSLLRRANPDEVREWHLLKQREREALVDCKHKAASHKLDMKILRVRFASSQRKVIFYFTSEKRVDFRELVKDLAGAFHARIELWQIGVRDEARQIGGLGSCGRQLCCASWLRDFAPVSIRYAKSQDLQFSPGKLAGTCGRLRCCLAYEQDQYVEMGKGVPPIGAKIESAELGAVKVTDRNLLRRTLTIYNAEGKSQIVSLARVKSVAPPKDDPTAKRSWIVEPEREAAAYPESRGSVDRGGAYARVPAGARAERKRDDATGQGRPLRSREALEEPKAVGPATDTKAQEEAAAKRAMRNEAQPSLENESADEKDATKRRRRRRGRGRGSDENAANDATTRSAKPGGGARSQGSRAKSTASDSKPEGESKTKGSGKQQARRKSAKSTASKRPRQKPPREKKPGGGEGKNATDKKDS